jgi:hypothetical protein
MLKKAQKNTNFVEKYGLFSEILKMYSQKIKITV